MLKNENNVEKNHNNPYTKDTVQKFRSESTLRYLNVKKFKTNKNTSVLY